jgi:hypothetical protein
LLNLAISLAGHHPDLTLWWCLVRVRNVALPMDVVVNDRTKVVLGIGQANPCAVTSTHLQQ